MRPVLHQVRVPSLPRRVRPWPSGASAVPDAWVVNGGAVSLAEGSGATFDVAATGPSGYTAGGAYGVDPAATVLPSGMTLSAAGSLGVGSAVAQVANGVVFTYHEPGALPVLTLHSASAGTFPYLATAYPAEGAVPAGQVLVSADDANLRSSVLSAWPDGSAQVVVLAGEKTVAASSQVSVALRPGAAQGAALTAARVGQLVSSIAVNFGGGVQTLSNFGSPDRIWWANERVICARYRLSCGLGVMEAVIDIHAFSSARAFVEVVIENGKFNANLGNQSAPASQSYTNATVAVNGTTIATVSSSGGPSGSHRGFSAWYAGAQIDSGVVTVTSGSAAVFGIEVTHNTASMQAHPVLYRYDQANPYNYLTQTFPPGEAIVNWPTQTYAADAYSPWITGRLRASSMGSPSDSEGIGPLTQWDTRYLQSGDKYVRRAVLTHALATLTYNVNYRHAGTGTSDGCVPNSDQSVGFVHSAGTWPSTGSEGQPAVWEVAHHPAVGLVAFMCRPSPCFIEIAQKIAHWNGSWSNRIDGGAGDGTFGPWYQVRGKGWGMRSLGHAIFLTPDGHPWKAPAKSALTRNVTGMLQFRDSAANKLDFMWSGTPTEQWDDDISNSKHDASNLMHNYFALGCVAAARVRVLSGADQTNADALADWSCKYPVRWINEAPSGAWRLVTIHWSIAPVGHNANFSDNPNFNEYADYAALAPGNYSGTVPALQGTWLSGEGKLTDYSQGLTQISAGAYYPSYFWSVLTLAVERDISGASTAWDKVVANITNLTTWRNGFATEPRWGFYPRNK